MTKQQTDLIGSAEACELLGVDRATLSRWASAGRIKSAVKLDGVTGARLFHRTDVEALRRKNQPTTNREGEQCPTESSTG